MVRAGTIQATPNTFKGKTMALVRTGGGITDIRGGLGGVYFSRDRFGLHSSSKPRNIHRRSADQDRQRRAFSKARAYSTDPRFVSYNIYRILNGLEPADPPPDFQIGTL